jgi:hypothetical protein
MSDAEQDQDQTQDQSQDQVDAVDRVDRRDAELLMDAWGPTGRELHERLDDFEVDLLDQEVEDWFRKAGSPRHVAVADWLKSERDTKEREEREREQQRLVDDEVALRAKVRSNLIREAEDAKKAERKKALRAEVAAELERERAGTPAVDPVAIAVDRLTEISGQLDDRTLSEEQRAELWRAAGEAEDAMAAASVSQVPDTDLDAFRARLKERMQRG